VKKSAQGNSHPVIPAQAGIQFVHLIDLTYVVGTPLDSGTPRALPAGACAGMTGGEVCGKKITASELTWGVI
jgi:hypothetical protein